MKEPRPSNPTSNSTSNPNAATGEQLLEFAREVWSTAHELITAVDTPLQVEMGLSFREVVILAAVHRGVTKPSELAVSLGLTAPTVSRSIEALEHRGFLNRSANLSDRRSITLTVTAKGLQARQEATHHMTRMLGERFAEVDANSLDNATKALREMDIK